MKRIASLIFTAAVIIVINSCQKDINENLPDHEIVFGIEQAKSWLESNYPDQLEFKSGDKTKKCYLDRNWDKAKTYQNSKVEIVEIPLESDSMIGFITPEIYELIQESGTYSYAHNITRLVIQKYKESGLIAAHFMTITGDPVYMEKTNFKLKKNNVLLKEKDYSGMVLFHNLNGFFNVGWKYEEGKITHKINSTDPIRSGLRLKTATLNCYTVEMYETVITYLEYPDGTTYIQNVDINWIGSYDYCVYGSGTNEGSSGSDGMPDLEEMGCNCDLCPICGGCVTDGQPILKQADLPPPEADDEPGTTTTSEETFLDCPNCICLPLIFYDESFVGSKAECVYNKLRSTTLMEDLLKEFVGSTRYHLTYKVVSSYISPRTGYQTPGTIKDNGDGTMTILINSYFDDKRVPVSLAKTLLHETIHAHIFREVESLGGLDEIESSTFENLAEYYNLYDEEEVQHEYISNYYISKMAKALEKYDSKKFAYSYYEALAWDGLYTTYPWYHMTEAEKQAIRDKIAEINEGLKECIK